MDTSQLRIDPGIYALTEFGIERVICQPSALSSKLLNFDR